MNGVNISNHHKDHLDRPQTTLSQTCILVSHGVDLASEEPADEETTRYLRKKGHRALLNTSGAFTMTHKERKARMEESRDTGWILFAAVVLWVVGIIWSMAYNPTWSLTCIGTGVLVMYALGAPPVGVNSAKRNQASGSAHIMRLVEVNRG